MTAACRLAKARLARATMDLSGPTSMASRVGTGVRAGFIGGVKTPAKGLLGNATHLGSHAVLQPGQAGVDAILAAAQAAAEWRKTGKFEPLQHRTVINAVNKQGIAAITEGLRSGYAEVRGAYDAGVAAKAAMDLIPKSKFAEGNLFKRSEAYMLQFGRGVAAMTNEMKTHILDANKAALLDYTPTKYKYPLTQALTDAAFLAVEAVDVPFHRAAKAWSENMQYRLAAKKAGATGARIETLAKELQAAGDPTIDLQATIDANYLTFKDRGVAAKTAEQMKRNFERWSESDDAGVAFAGGVAKVGADVIIPFTGVPTSMGKKGIELTPLGALGLAANTPHIIDVLRGVDNPRPGLTQQRNAQLIANSLIGTFSGVTLGKLLYENGMLVGKLTPAERADDRDRKEYSINFGGHSISLMSLGHLVTPLFAGLNLAKMAEEDPGLSTLDAAAGVGRSAVAQTLNSTYAQGAKNTLDAFSDENKSLTSYLAGLVPMPSGVTQVSRLTDPQPREGISLGDRLLNKTPFSATLEPALTSTGIARERTWPERIQSVVSPVDFGKREVPPAIREIQRLGLTIGLPDKNLQFNNEKRPLSYEGRKDIVTKQGDIIPRIEELMSSPAYLNKPIEAQREQVEKIIRAGKARAKLESRRQMSDTSSGFFNAAR